MSRRSSLKSVQMIELVGRIYNKMSVYLEEGRPIPIAFEKIAENALPWLEKLEMIVDAADGVHSTFGPIKELLDHLRKSRGGR